MDRPRATEAIEAIPRFALAAGAETRIGERLAAIGWRAVAAAPELSELAPQRHEGCDVVVVACETHTLLSPAFQMRADRVAGGLPCVAIVIHPGPEAAPYAARLGWRGFVSADSPATVIARTIGAAARGELAFPPSATMALARALAEVAPVTQTAGSGLTPRQNQIVTLIAQGATDAEIASLLRISRSTAYKHVQNARRRLRAKTRSQLVAASRDPILVAGGPDQHGDPGAP